MPELVTLAGPMTDVLLGWFAETTLVASALAALVALVVRARRIAPGPAARHALWLLVLLKLVTPPLVHWPWSVPCTVAPAESDAARPGEELIPPVGDVTTRVAGPGSGIDRRLVPAPLDPSPSPATSVGSEPGAGGPAPSYFPAMPRSLRSPGAWLVSAWLVGSIGVGVGQARRVSRFRRLLLDATPAPAWLVDEAGRVGRHLAVRVPTILVVPGLGTPVLWCLGRPVLLVPSKLLQALESGRWRAILAHELAHLRRGDHWVRRLELVAGLAWWWNPLYWLARNRLDFEAELACDAWAVWDSPRGRVSYAESLVRICTALSSAESPAPALGVVGTGHSFERRLTMILSGRADRRIPAPSLLAGSLLVALALPSWTMAGPSLQDDARPLTPATAEPVARQEADDVEEPRDDAPSAEKQKAAKLRAEREALRKKLEALDKELEEKAEPDSDFAKGIEKQFGPGSDFARKMEALGAEMEAKFGPNSDFARKMEAMGKEMEAKFGPGSDFAREMEAKFGPGSDFARKVKEAVKEGDQEDSRAKIRVEMRARAKAEVDKARAAADQARSAALKARSKADANAKAEARPRGGAAPDDRARRIEALESRIDGLKRELDRLKAESDGSRGDARRQ